MIVIEAITLEERVAFFAEWYAATSLHPVGEWAIETDPRSFDPYNRGAK